MVDMQDAQADDGKECDESSSEDEESQPRKSKSGPGSRSIPIILDEDEEIVASTPDTADAGVGATVTLDPSANATGASTITPNPIAIATAIGTIAAPVVNASTVSTTQDTPSAGGTIDGAGVGASTSTANPSADATPDGKTNPANNVPAPSTEAVPIAPPNAAMPTPVADALKAASIDDDMHSTTSIETTEKPTKKTRFSTRKTTTPAAHAEIPQGNGSVAGDNEPPTPNESPDITTKKTRSATRKRKAGEKEQIDGASSGVATRAAYVFVQRTHSVYY